jgi:electron transfer flavoprotein beta subunit
MALNIIVCLKQVSDPEAPVSGYKVDTEAKRVISPPGTPPVINPDDENALEAALRIKDTHESKITVISLGRNLSKPVLQKSLAVGADELVFLTDEAFDDLDSYATAFVLSTAIKRLGEYDFIFTGRMAADSNASQVGCGIAEFLDIPCVTAARKVELRDGRVRVEQTIPDGYEVVEARLPVLVTVSSEFGDLRTASLPQVMAARKKTVTTLKSNELGIDLSQLSDLRRSKLLKLSPPPRREVSCEIIKGETVQEAGANLALKLKEAGVI